MAISTFDHVIAGVQPPRAFAKALTGTMVAGRPWTLWGTAGIPGAGSYDTTLNGVTLSSSSSMVNGQIPWTDPSGALGYLCRFQGNATIPGTLLLCDRIWHNGGFTITSTGSQSITSPTWPARDANGATSGDGVLLMLEISAAAGAAAPTITVGYTNQAGTASRSATNLIATANSPAAGSAFFIGLQAGDTGVRSVQSLTLSVSWVSGTMNLVAYRVLASLELSAGNIGAALDALSSGLPRVYDGSVPFLVFIPSTTTTSNITGSVVWTQG